MRKLHRTTIVMTLLVLVLTLGACSPLSQPVIASPEARPAAGGGSMAVSSGQAGEGLVVIATGTASADPEVAQVDFGVELQGESPDSLVSEATQKMEAAMAAAQEFGIVEDKTRTLAYNLWVETVRDPETGQPSGEIIYHLNHQVQVTTNNIDDVGALLGGIVTAGANVISGVSFAVEDPSALLDEARDLAIEAAQAKAESMAQKLGIGFGDPILVTETGSSAPTVMMADYGIGGGTMMEAAAPQIEAGALSVSVSIQIIYEIQ